MADSLTFGNERAVPAEGGVFAGGGVAAKQRLRFVGKEAFGAVHRRLLHTHTASPTHATTAAVVAAGASAAGRLERLVDGTEALAYIHRCHQLVDVKLEIETEMKVRRGTRGDKQCVTHRLLFFEVWLCSCDAFGHSIC